MFVPNCLKHYFHKSINMILVQHLIIGLIFTESETGHDKMLSVTVKFHQRFVQVFNSFTYLQLVPRQIDRDKSVLV